MRAAVCAQFDICYCGDFRHQHVDGQCFCDCTSFVYTKGSSDEEIAKQLSRELVTEARQVLEAAQ